MSSKKKPASSRKAGERRQTPEKKPSPSKTARLVKETVSPATSATAERVVAPEGERVRQVADLGKIWERIGKAREPQEFRVACVRPDDLLVCDFVFENLRLEASDGDGAPKLLRKDSVAAAALIVELPPQSFGEEAFLDATGPEVSSTPTGKNSFKETSKAVDAKNVAVTKAEPLPPLSSARIRMAGRSRLAFTMPADETELLFTIEKLLDACRRWPMRLDVNAVPDPPRFPIRAGGFGVADKWLASVAASPAWTSRANP